MLNNIIKIFDENFAGEKQKIIPRNFIYDCMKSDDIEVLGALYVLITDERFYKRIDPPLTLEDYFPFVLKYLKRCFIENPDGEWSDSNYTAGWDLNGWFNSLWNDENVNRKYLDKIKKWLAELYLNGDSKLRLCIETATLEHLFEDKKIVAYFKDWELNPVLKNAYKASR